MWTAAMAAAAPFASDPAALVNAGLSEVPATSRLADELTDVLRWYSNDIEYEQAVKRVHERWDETDEFEYVHTLSNAQTLSIWLLWGDGAFEPPCGVLSRPGLTPIRMALRSGRSPG